MQSGRGKKRREEKRYRKEQRSIKSLRICGILILTAQMNGNISVTQVLSIFMRMLQGVKSVGFDFFLLMTP